MDPLVSVIIPVFNDSLVLSNTLLECSKQTYRKLEFIIVDDGSEDGLDDVVRHLHGPPRHCRIIRQRHLGLAAARNVGLGAARGTLVQFLDADDRLAADKIARQVRLLQRLPAGTVVYCDYRVLQGSEMRNVGRLGPPHIGLGEASLHERFTQWTVIHRFLFPIDIVRNIGSFDESQMLAEDLDLWLRLQVAGVHFVYDAAPAAFYVFRQGHSVRHPYQECISHVRALAKFRCLVGDNESRIPSDGSLTTTAEQWKTRFDSL